MTIRTGTVPATVDNFIRAETDLYFTTIAVKQGGFGKLPHHREMMPIDNQTIIRTNRDALYSSGVFDLDAGPVTLTLPDSGDRFMSLQLINEDMYSPPAIYQPGRQTFTRQAAGTRYRVDVGFKPERAAGIGPVSGRLLAVPPFAVRSTAKDRE